VQDQLVFVISPPRCGSTLLQRMLGSHSEVLTHPEPHLITPLAYLGYHDTVDAAPFDHINAAEAIRLFVSHLPDGEADYIEALRAYANTMYGRMLHASRKSRFVDKTPAYALVLPFLTKLYPRARYVVLTRHPLAVFSSYANSFFHGDWERAHAYNPILERYVPALAQLLRSDHVPLVHVAYEDLVRQPADELSRLFAFLGLEDEPDAVNYGDHSVGESGPGDPIGVQRHSRPVTDSLMKWAGELRADTKKLDLARSMLGRIDPRDLESWGWHPDEVFGPLETGGDEAPPKVPWNSYTLQRKLLLELRKNIHQRPHGRWIRKVRYYCDVLLRDSL
jgi:hypothetical protein